MPIIWKWNGLIQITKIGIQLKNALLTTIKKSSNINLDILPCCSYVRFGIWSHIEDKISEK